MIRRTAVERLLADSETDESAEPSSPTSMPAAERLIVSHESNELARADLPHSAAGPRQNSSFLGHLRNLALGE